MSNLSLARAPYTSFTNPWTMRSQARPLASSPVCHITWPITFCLYWKPVAIHAHQHSTLHNLQHRIMSKAQKAHCMSCTCICCVLYTSTNYILNVYLLWARYKALAASCPQSWVSTLAPFSLLPTASRHRSLRQSIYSRNDNFSFILSVITLFRNFNHCGYKCTTYPSTFFLIKLTWVPFSG